MGSIELSKIKGSSLFPGLQNIGTASTTAIISGTLPASGVSGGNLIGSINLTFPFSNVMSVIRCTLPDAHGDLANYWFPVVGTVELYDAVSAITYILYVQNGQTGRVIQFNLVNGTGSDIVLSSHRLEIVAHLYTFPWQDLQI